MTNTCGISDREREEEGKKRVTVTLPPGYAEIASISVVSVGLVAHVGVGRVVEIEERITVAGIGRGNGQRSRDGRARRRWVRWTYCASSCSYTIDGS